MSNSTLRSSMLYEMAQTMIDPDDCTTAVALRTLARAGYGTLQQVDSTPDWVLLATPGIGIRRLAAVRRLIRPGWQPPRPKAIKAAEQFLSAARFALRFWSIEDLEAVIQDSVSLPASDRPIEKRLSLHQFVQATRKALRHCATEDLVQTLPKVIAPQDGQPYRVPKPLHKDVVQCKNHNSDQGRTSSKHKPSTPRGRSGRDCEHFAFAAEKRREIVEHFLSARALGQVANKDAWAQANYNISGRTLLRYEHEYLETGADTQL